MNDKKLRFAWVETQCTAYAVENKRVMPLGQAKLERTSSGYNATAYAYRTGSWKSENLPAEFGPRAKQCQAEIMLYELIGGLAA